MSASLTVTKLDAAKRQLDAAIQLFFSDADPVVIHSLATSAANVLFDVAENGSNGTSWRTRMRDDNGLSTKDVKYILHKAWNFFKHAEHDPNGVLQFDPIDSEHMMFAAILECGDQDQTSCYMQAFQLWYIAAHPEFFPPTESVFVDAAQLFPNLASVSHAVQVQRGHAFLTEHCKLHGAET
ncbi:MAG: hypothetical protein AB1482_04860 [Pseudomonadota bacterium]